MTIEGRLGPPDRETLRIQAGTLRHPMLHSVDINFATGLSPYEAAIVAVLMNPALRAERDRLALSEAQVLQAGILPNPQVTGSLDFITGGTLVPGLTTGYGIGLSWNLQSLIQRGAKRGVASAGAEAIALDVAWKEWQTAESARLEVYRVIAHGAELTIAEEVDHQLAENLALISRAVRAHFKTAVDLSTAASASQDAHAVVLGLRQELAAQKFALAKALGVPPDADVRLKADIVLPSRLKPQAEEILKEGLEQRRLDLVALRHGYDSQEERVRLAVLGQFPRIGIGFGQASDTSNVHTAGPTLSIELPVFDRNQGVIAIELATRQRLFDEYISRVFEARSDIAKALTGIRSVTEQIASAETAIPVLQGLVETYRTAADEKHIDAFSFYSARTILNQKRLQVLRLKAQLIEHHVALELAAGLYLPIENSEDK